ncbi:MAG: hypothetical protein AB7G37_11680 [Solirubrobacteraceae bacterium]
MRATYDPRARAVAVIFVADARHGVVREVADGVYVGLRDDAPVMIELVGMGGADDEDRLSAGAAACGLDGSAIIAAVRAAVAVPGREVTVDVTAPRAA